MLKKESYLCKPITIGCVIYWSLTKLSIKRCTCVNKRKKKQKQVGVMKEYRQVPAAVELVGDRKARVRASLQTEWYGPQRLPVKQPQPRCRRSATMGKRRHWVNITVCPCLHSSLTHNRNLKCLKNKVWEIHIFIKKCVHSFIDVRKLYLIMFPLKCIFVFRLVYVYGYTKVAGLCISILDIYIYIYIPAFNFLVF